MFNVLIVEDDKNIRKLMEIKLNAEGYNTVSAEDGPVALDKVGSSHFDIVIVDAMMPNMNGYEFIKDSGANINSYQSPGYNILKINFTDYVVENRPANYFIIIYVCSFFIISNYFFL